MYQRWIGSAHFSWLCAWNRIDAICRPSRWLTATLFQDIPREEKFSAGFHRWLTLQIHPLDSDGSTNSLSQPRNCLSGVYIVHYRKFLTPTFCFRESNISSVARERDRESVQTRYVTCLLTNARYVVCKIRTKTWADDSIANDIINVLAVLHVRK